MSNQNKQVLVYGADWCGDCKASKAFLDKKGVDYEYFDVEMDENKQKMLEITNGSKIIPAILIDGTLYQEPSLIELKEALQK